MTNLKTRGRRLSLFFPLVLAGCATSFFNVAEDDNRTEVFVSPDRVILECEHIHDADEKNRYGFMIHILDDQNSVLTAAQMNLLDKQGCSDRYTQIGKILKNGKKIHLGGMQSLSNQNKKVSDREYNFPGKGTFKDDGRTLQFIVIWNELGQCYDAYSGNRAPCPRNDFPIRRQ